MALPDSLVALNKEYAQEFKNSPVRHSQIVESDGEAVIEMGGAGMQSLSIASVSVFDTNGDPVTAAVGVAQGNVLLLGATKSQDFSNPINLAEDTWSWAPQIALTKTFKLTVAGLTTGYFFGLTIAAGE
ncbi:MAG: hypothetical protein GY881_15800 [Gammaproteobacteria bacterium]|nr:hypothetical protein [Gammaproteobacteria bacterium]MCP4791689.1 hypothetical protein [Gammaproteobacteria bacterium]